MDKLTFFLYNETMPSMDNTLSTVTITHMPDVPTTTVPLEAPINLVAETPSETLYMIATGLIGHHLTMDESVPWMVGCMEAVSFILDAFAVPGIPVTGFAGTAAGLAFILRSPRFMEVNSYTVGAVIIAATGTGNGKIRGHVGICGKIQIMSNNSETGKWDTQWTIDRWLAYYTNYGGIKTRYFLPV